jgi:membrane protease YdiL (CAAX protease family)
VGFWSDEKPEAVLRAIFRKHDRAELWRLSYWSFATFFAYFLLPAVYIRFFLKERLTDFGLQLQGTLKHSWIYIVLFLAVLPLVIIMSMTESFQRTYPFYDQAHRSVQDFLAWQVLYAIQFFSLEFFFRGFLIHGMKHRFGYYAIVFSVVPYCMIHFGKPLPETLGAIIAGLALGTLSVFTRSIWLGVAIHISVAVSMDISSLIAQGKLVWPDF